MIQTIVIPEKTVEVSVKEVHFNIEDMANITARVVMRKDPVGSTVKNAYIPIVVNATQLITDEVTAGNLTAADVQGFKKVAKAIIAGALETAYTDINDL